MSGIKQSQIKAMIKSARRKHADSARYIGITSDFAWSGGQSVEADGQAYDVVQCCSELHMRDVMATATVEGRPTVIVTPLSDAELGEDLRLRLCGCRLQVLKAWDNVASIFSAHYVDPRVTKHKWIADELLEIASIADVKPADNGTLTADAVWSILLDRLLGLPSASPDVVGLLIWSNRHDSRSRISALNEDYYQVICEWLTMKRGLLAEAVLHSLRCGTASPLAIGMVCEVIYSRENRPNSRLGKAEIRLEGETRLKDLDRNLAQQWAKAAAGAIERLSEPGASDGTVAVFQEVDQLLTTLEIPMHADRSSLLPSGFEQRLAAYSAALLKWLGQDEMPEDLPVLLQQLEGHRQSGREPHRYERAVMAMRLLRYLHEADAGDPDFAASITRYRQSGAYADWARTVLHAGESNSKVAQIYGRILEEVAVRRHEQNRRFAEHLAAATTDDIPAPDGVIFVEDILDKVVAKVNTNVAVMVLDGMSHAVFYELMNGFPKEWSMYDDPAGGFSVTGLATIPSKTNMSRGSLLSGRLNETQSAGEKKNFGKTLKVAGHTVPAVFHKAELTASGGAVLSPQVLDAMSSDSPIICAVVNAIDDDLDKGDQVVKQWNLRSLSLLDMLLKAAAENDRCVLLLSDHGHVLDRGSKLIDGGKDSGERYRPPGGDLHEGEIAISGRRVLHDGGVLVVPWDEKLRYKKKKYGYHGGVTPQEMLVPVALLAHGPHGDWRDRVLEPPIWWSGVVEAPPVPVVTHSKVVPAKDDQFKKLPLFEGVPASVETVEVVSLPWVEKLLASTVYKAQRETYGRIPVKDEQVAMFLEVLESRGGSCLRPALAKQLDMPAMRVKGFISNVRRLLNVDGYLSIEFEENSDTVTLNSPMLKTQFGLKTDDK